MMKKSIFLLLLVLCVSTVMAQKGKVSAAQSYRQTNDLDAAKKAIELALKHEKSKDWPKTYIVAAQVYTDMYKNGQDAKGIYKAVEYYKKAIELDKKGDEKGKGIGKFEKEIKLALTFFLPELTNAGIEGFSADDFSAALTAFESVLMFNDMDLLKAENATLDTAIVYNCALAAYNAKNWQKAEQYLKQSIDMKYGGGDAVFLLKQVYEATSDSVKIGNVLKLGFEQYPNDDRILPALIQYYLDSKQNKEALAYLDTAIEKDPENPTFYHARGVLYEKIDKDKAIGNYEKCLEIDDQFFNALYYIGVLYFNEGVGQQGIANDQPSVKEFEAAMKVANEYWEKSMAYMEKAHEVKPEEVAVLETLKGLYYRFERTDKYNEVKAKIEALKVN